MSTKNGFNKEIETKKNKTSIVVAIIGGVAIMVAAIFANFLNKPSSENTEIKNNKNSPIARDIQTQNNYYYPELKDSNHKKESDHENQKNDLRTTITKNNTNKIEVSIQLKNIEDGVKSIKVQNIDAEILPNSTSTNPRILVESIPNKIQTIVIITKLGDTCVLQRIFDKNYIKDFPIRFIPDCKNESND